MICILDMPAWSTFFNICNPLNQGAKEEKSQSYQQMQKRINKTQNQVLIKIKQTINGRKLPQYGEKSHENSTGSIRFIDEKQCL